MVESSEFRSTRIPLNEGTGQMPVLGFGTLIPDAAGRDFVHNSIYDEFDKQIFREETRQKYREIIDDLRDSGAEGVILGCTEIPLLIKQSDCSIPAFDTTFIHAKYAVDFACSDRKDIRES